MTDAHDVTDVLTAQLGHEAAIRATIEALDKCRAAERAWVDAAVDAVDLPLVWRDACAHHDLCKALEQTAHRQLREAIARDMGKP